MKITRILPAIMLGLAASVTAGSVYVTVQAAAQQEEDVFGLPEIAEEAVEQPEEVPAVPVIDEAPPEEVLHNRGHYIVLDQDGGFTGKLVGLTDSGLVDAEGLTVKILRDGAQIAEATTTAEGTFSLRGLTDSTVAMLAYGNGHFALYAVNLRSPDHFEVPVAVQEIAVTTAVASGANAEAAKSLIYGNPHKKLMRFEDSVVDADRVYPRGEVGDLSTSIDHHSVMLQDDGSLVGQVNLLDPRIGHHRGVNDLTIHFVKDGVVVGSTEVEESGAFRMPGLSAGNYAVATTGRDGILVLGVEVIEAPTVAARESGRYKLTSAAQTLNLVVAPVRPEDFSPAFADGPTNPPEGTIVDVAPPFGPAGFSPGGGIGGGAGAGGGGFGGGGGLGALLGAAAGAGIGYAIAENDDAAATPNRVIP